MNELELTGLDGSNPLGFLAALGTLRALTSVWPDQRVRMSWIARDGWRPVLHVHEIAPKRVVSVLHKQVQAVKTHPTLGIADNLNIAGDIYRKHLCEQVKKSQELDPTAFVAAFGCDAIRDNNDNIVDTALRTMSGAGHQHFLKTMRDVLEKTTAEHIEKALFKPWRYDDPLQSLSLRFDPLDDKRYALRWDDPSGDPNRSKRGNMLGANALAVLGIPLCVVVPIGRRLETTGFRGQRSSDCFWTWPIWDVPLTLAVVSSLIALSELQQNEVPRANLSARGVGEIFRSQRITVGKFRNFTPAHPV